MYPYNIKRESRSSRKNRSMFPCFIRYTWTQWHSISHSTLFLFYLLLLQMEIFILSHINNKVLIRKKNIHIKINICIWNRYKYTHIIYRLKLYMQFKKGEGETRERRKNRSILTSSVKYIQTQWDSISHSTLFGLLLLKVEILVRPLRNRSIYIQILSPCKNKFKWKQREMYSKCLQGTP